MRGSSSLEVQQSCVQGWTRARLRQLLPNLHAVLSYLQASHRVTLGAMRISGEGIPS